jgi:hypothetical protein
MSLWCNANAAVSPPIPAPAINVSVMNPAWKTTFHKSNTDVFRKL